MNRLEREVLEELEDDSYEFNEDKAVAIVALVREAVEQEVAERELEKVSDPVDEILMQLAQRGHGVTMATKPVYATTSSWAGVPNITTTLDSLRQHINVRCDCGWGLVVSTSRNDFNDVLTKDINEHGNAHGINF